jgi:cell wall-associated NlpC family hydrolase
MTELTFRTSIVTEALTWIGTPYKQCARIKGVGCNCAQLLFGVAMNAHAISPDSPEPRWYTPQLATHSREEKLIGYLLAYGAVEITEDRVKPGDLVLYKTGKSHGHAAIVIEWPEKIIHALPPRGTQLGRVDEGRLGQFSRRYFTLWTKD